MSLITEWVAYGGGRRTGYLARPERAGDSLPAVLVIQEIWGVDEHIQDVTRRFAQAGYAALAPDLFAEDGRRPEALDAGRLEGLKRFMDGLPASARRSPEEREPYFLQLSEPERRQVRESYEAVFGGVTASLPKYAGMVSEAAAYLRSDCPFTRGQKLGVVGFCMGGALSAQLACADPELQASVIFYGNAPRAEQLPGIACPVLGIYGELDQRINEGIPEFAAGMEKAGKTFEYRIYPGAPHAFFNDTRPSYHVSSARDAWVRTLAFLRERLG